MGGKRGETVSLPASPSVGLTAFLPVLRQERYGLTTFHKVDKDGLGALSPPVALDVHDRVLSRPCTRYSALLAQAWQHLWLVAHHDVYQEFTCVHHTLHPAPSPPDAGRYALPSRCRRQSKDCGYRVRGLCTGRYLPAHPRRILLMEQQVWSISMPDNQPCDLVSQREIERGALAAGRPRTTMATPCWGRKVNRGCGTTCWPATSATS